MTRAFCDVLRDGVSVLRKAGVRDPARDARLLLADAAEIASDRLTLHLPDPWPETATDRWNGHLSARAARQPVAQIIGRRDFYGRSFAVTSDVLDPRPETEVLVGLALQVPAQQVLDIGTGSGCILLSLLAAWPQAQGVGTDCSSDALTVAKRNADALGVADRTVFTQTNWATDVPGTFDLIVSNPPYIAEDELKTLDPEVVDWEPPQALSPGGDGLSSYQALIPQACDRLRDGGRLLMEIGPTQGLAVQEMCRSNGLQDVEIHPDWDGRDRVVSGFKASGL